MNLTRREYTCNIATIIWWYSKNGNVRQLLNRTPTPPLEVPLTKEEEPSSTIGGCINEYIHGNNPRKKVLKVRKYYYLYNVSDPMIWNGHIDESVFALSFQENVVVFNESKDKRQHRSSVFVCVYSTPNDTGVGIVSVYLLWLMCKTLCLRSWKNYRTLADRFKGIYICQIHCPYISQ